MDLSERGNGSLRGRHPWEFARADFFTMLLERRGLLTTGREWLDAGAGDAWLAQQLRRRLSPQASLVCWDANYSESDLASDVEGITFVAERPRGYFDRVLMLDVLEHVVDDGAFLADAVRELLSEEGWVLVSVPAYAWLFSSHDVYLRHRRRYSPEALRELLERAGLSVASGGGLFVSLLPIRLGRVVLERFPGIVGGSRGIGYWRGGPTATWALAQALLADGRLSLALAGRGFSLPGLSFWALCQRRARTI